MTEVFSASNLRRTIDGCLVGETTGRKPTEIFWNCRRPINSIKFKLTVIKFIVFFPF